jgi:myo-inositol-1(or 4)-monophosphatase
MPTAELIHSHLASLFQSVFQVVTTGKAETWGKLGKNAKGDQVKWFDLAADQAVCAYLEECFPYPVKLLSEEGEPRIFGAGEPEWTMILDPVDGSENFSRGLAPTAMAMALIPAHLPIAVQTVEYALVGDLYLQKIWQAARGRGATCNGLPIQTSRVRELEQAFLSCDLNQAAVQSPLSSLFGKVQGVRAFGSAAMVLARVADGAIDAHLDVRNRLTPENFLAPGLIITEAGGLFTDSCGQPLPEISSLTEVYSVVAAGTPELHQALLQYFSDVD